MVVSRTIGGVLREEAAHVGFCAPQVLGQVAVLELGVGLRILLQFLLQLRELAQDADAACHGVVRGREGARRLRSWLFGRARPGALVLRFGSEVLALGVLRTMVHSPSSYLPGTAFAGDQRARAARCKSFGLSIIDLLAFPKKL